MADGKTAPAGRPSPVNRIVIRLVGIQVLFYVVVIAASELLGYRSYLTMVLMHPIAYILIVGLSIYGVILCRKQNCGKWDTLLSCLSVAVIPSLLIGYLLIDVEYRIDFSLRSWRDWLKYYPIVQYYILAALPFLTGLLPAAARAPSPGDSAKNQKVQHAGL
jgi:hypothetical protein